MCSSPTRATSAGAPGDAGSAAESTRGGPPGKLTGFARSGMSRGAATTRACRGPRRVSARCAARRSFLTDGQGSTARVIARSDGTTDLAAKLSEKPRTSGITASRLAGCGRNARSRSAASRSRSRRGRMRAVSSTVLAPATAGISLSRRSTSYVTGASSPSRWNTIPRVTLHGGVITRRVPRNAHTLRLRSPKTTTTGCAPGSSSTGGRSLCGTSCAR